MSNQEYTEPTNVGESALLLSSSSSPSELRDEVVDVPHVSRDFEVRKQWIIYESRQSITKLAIQSKKSGRIPDPTKPGVQQLLDRARKLLTFLEHDFQVKPSYNEGDQKLSNILKIIFDDARFHFPAELRERAQALCEDFEAENWGAANAPDDDDDNDDDNDDDDNTQQSESPGSSDENVGRVIIRIRLPPRDHPIWGVRGIMHGIAIKEGKKMTAAILDRRYIAEKRDPKVFGHNGLQPGTWFPSQLVALFHGAHGARMAGIHGTALNGTWSVVVAGMYEDVDEDHGDTIYYSGPNSQIHTDPVTPPGGSTNFLERSLTTGHPIRVLRAAHRKGTHAPSVGIRYDGLYRITGRANQTNAKGGLFVQYVLRRQDGQEALSDIIRRSPAQQQRHDYCRIKEYW